MFQPALNLTTAMRLPHLPRLAVVGAGGKTSLLFQAGRELLSAPNKPASTVIITTTTHLGKWQVDLADYQIMAGSARQLFELTRELPPGLVAITGPELSDQRMEGLDRAGIDHLAELAEQRQLPMLIEADGARLRSLKAPGAHEPAIPAFARQVVVCAGVSALGQLLTDAVVHRAERFSSLSGLKLGEVITPEAIWRVLVDGDGGAKNIPAQAQRVVLLTQANTSELQAIASEIAEQALPSYDRVVVCRSLPATQATQSVSQLETLAVYERVAAVVLAAGDASRYGSPKQLLDWNGKPFIRQVVESALQARLWPVIVVVGAYSDAVSMALSGLPVQIVMNADWEKGQSTSIQAGVGALPGQCGSVVFMLCDQPQVSQPLVRSLVERHQQTLAPIIAPLIDGQRGNPVLFDRETFDSFGELTQDQGGRALFARFPVEWLEWQDTEQLLDVDTPEDYQRLMRRNQVID